MGTAGTYKEVKAWQGVTLRQRLRHTAMDALVLKDRFAPIEARLRRPRVQFLYVHHCFPDEERALHRLLDALAKHHHFISYDEAVERVIRRDIDRPYICFSSDDGFRNNLAAGRILAEHGAKACFFINPALIGERDPQRIARHCAERLSFPPVDFLDWHEVGELQRLGHAIGSHTMEHRNVASMTAAEVLEDMQRCRAIIREKCGTADHFAYPYGRATDFTAEARSICAAAGYRSCASAERGCHVGAAAAPDPDRLILRRDHVLLDWPLGHIMHFIAHAPAHP
jgi:peptidoglycan/xylan/chitin deacetylase (PgdA/CDA1 family)